MTYKYSVITFSFCVVVVVVVVDETIKDDDMISIENLIIIIRWNGSL